MTATISVRRFMRMISVLLAAVRRRRMPTTATGPDLQRQPRLASGMTTARVVMSPLLYVLAPDDRDSPARSMKEKMPIRSADRPVLGMPPSQSPNPLFRKCTSRLGNISVTNFHDSAVPVQSSVSDGNQRRMRMERRCPSACSPWVLSPEPGALLLRMAETFGGALSGPSVVEVHR